MLLAAGRPAQLKPDRHAVLIFRALTCVDRHFAERRDAARCHAASADAENPQTAAPADLLIGTWMSVV